MTDFFGYLTRITGGATRADIARAAGVSASTVTRWEHTPPKADAVIAVAQHWGAPPLEALIEAGILTPRDAAVRIADRSLSTFPHSALLRELERRLDRAAGEEELSPDDFDLAAGHIDRPDDIAAD